MLGLLINTTWPNVTCVGHGTYICKLRIGCWAPSTSIAIMESELENWNGLDIQIFSNFDIMVRHILTSVEPDENSLVHSPVLKTLHGI